MITVIVFVWMVLYAGMLYSVFRIFDSGIEKEWFECFLWLLSFIFLFWLFSSYVDEWKWKSPYWLNAVCVKPETKSGALFCKNLLKWDKPMNISEKMRI